MYRYSTLSLMLLCSCAYASEAAEEMSQELNMQQEELVCDATVAELAQEEVIASDAAVEVLLETDMQEEQLCDAAVEMEQEEQLCDAAVEPEMDADCVTIADEESVCLEQDDVIAIDVSEEVAEEAAQEPCLSDKIFETYPNCVVAVDEERMYLDENSVIVTDKELFLYTAGKQLLPLPMLQRDQFGYFVPIAESTDRE